MMRLIRRILAGVSALILGSLVLGFVLYVRQIPASPTTPLPESDVIVVLTGGRGRIEAGVNLLDARAAPYLYISGVDEKLEKKELARQFGLSQAQVSCCLFTDQRADSTLTNALVTTRWLADTNRQRIILVTSNYHMPRSLREFRAVAPDLVITPYPTGAPWTARRILTEKRALPFLLDEYAKLVVHRIRRAAGVRVQ